MYSAYPNDDMSRKDDHIGSPPPGAGECGCTEIDVLGVVFVVEAHDDIRVRRPYSAKSLSGAASGTKKRLASYNNDWRLAYITFRSEQTPPAEGGVLL
jgi:hypothetical protein